MRWALRIQEGADLIYTDEDKVTADCQEHYQPHFKPDFNLDLLRSNNYICHFLVVKKTADRKGRRLPKEFDGAQDHDFIFRCCEQAEKIAPCAAGAVPLADPSGFYGGQSRQQALRL